jgi:hypothetical protein
MTEDDRIIRALTVRIRNLERRLDELEKSSVSWHIRTAHLAGTFPRQSPDGVFKYSQPLVTTVWPR